MQVFVPGGDRASYYDPIDVEFRFGKRVTAWLIAAKRERPRAVLRANARLGERRVKLVRVRDSPATVTVRWEFGYHLEQQRYVEA